jgi:hypothetical protein
VRGPRPHLVISSIFLKYSLTVSIQTLTTLFLHRPLPRPSACNDDLHGKVCTYANVRGPRTSIVINSISSTHTDLIDITHDDNFYQALSSNAVISSLDTGMSLTGNVRARKAPGIDFMTLSKRWCISPHTVKMTITKTTQRGTQKCLDPSLTRRFPTNDHMLRYKSMPHACFTDMLVAGTTP